MSLKLLTGLCLSAILCSAAAQTTTPVDLSAGPKPIRPDSWVRSSDYPKEALRNEQKGTVRFAMTIDADGAVARCDIVAPSAVAALDEKACSLMRRNGKFEPALDAAGQFIASEVTRYIAWDSKASTRLKYDALVAVKSLPSGRQSAEFTVRQIVSADNVVESCTSEGADDEPKLLAQACKIASQVLPRQTLRAADGSSVRGLRVSRFLLVVNETETEKS